MAEPPKIHIGSDDPVSGKKINYSMLKLMGRLYFTLTF